MTSVANRIRQVEQPHKGFLNPKSFKTISMDDGKVLFPEENLYSDIISSAVDYLTRLSLGTSPKEAFHASLMGAANAGQLSGAVKLLNDVVGLDGLSISNACKLSGYDDCYKAGMAVFRPVDEIKPDENTIHNIRMMVERSIRFIKEYGPITKGNLTFEGGYSGHIVEGEGDFMTEDTLWDFRVSPTDPTKDQTLQLLVYYLLGQHSVHKEYRAIKSLGIFNPRLNKVYLLQTKDIPKKSILRVSSEVIGY